MLECFTQPLTASQLAHRTGLSFDTCRDVVRKLHAKKLIGCLNPDAQRSRLYWPTQPGQDLLMALDRLAGRPPRLFSLQDLDWSLYGWLCYAHRAVIVRTLSHPMQPAKIKRRARSEFADLRMSANNVRDVIKLFLRKGIVRPVIVKKCAYRHYELTEQGATFRELLMRAIRPF